MFTDNQFRILAALTSHKDREYYMSELGEVLGKHPGVFQRGLNSLESQGYVTSRKYGNQRLFRINVNHPLFNEIRSIASKTQGIEGLLKSAIDKLSGIVVALIYGSYAKNKMRADSDIDLLVVCKSRDSEDRLVSKLSAIERRVQRDVNCKVYLVREFRRKQRSRDPFLEEVLRGKYILLKGSL